MGGRDAPKAVPISAADIPGTTLATAGASNHARHGALGSRCVRTKGSRPLLARVFRRSR